MAWHFASRLSKTSSAATPGPLASPAAMEARCLKTEAELLLLILKEAQSGTFGLDVIIESTGRKLLADDQMDRWTRKILR